MNILFVCGMNQWRSPTGAAIFKNSPVHAARSAGTSPNARIKISQSLIDWADIVFVMEKRHRLILAEKYLLSKQIIVLDIPDEYQYMDPELVAMIRISIMPYVGELD